MKIEYSISVEIDRPHAQVAALLEDPDCLQKWIPELESIELTEGEAKAPGSKSVLRFKQGKKCMEMLETVDTWNMPEGFSVTYTSGPVINHVANRLEPIDGGRTRWTADNVFILKGLMMNLMGVFMRGAFPKQSRKYAEQFKAFAESEAAE